MSRSMRLPLAVIAAAATLIALATWVTIALLPGNVATAATPPAATHAGMRMVAAPRLKTAAPAMSMAPQAVRKLPYGTKPLGYTLDHGVKVFHLVAERARWRTDAHTVVSAWTYNGQVPGPLLRLRQGDRIRIVVTNRLAEPTAVHWHGLDVPNAMDGVPGVTMKAIAPGRSFTYAFRVTNAPGLYLYHPHYDSLKQMSSGMYGALVVDPKTGPAPGVHEMFQVLSSMNGQYLINGKSFPSTDTYSFPQGAKVLIRTISADTAMNHPMHVHGFSFREVGINGGAVPRRLQFPMFEQDVAPGETYDMLTTVDHAGTWLYHCHNLTHVTGMDGQDAGMITVFKVTPAA